MAKQNLRTYLENGAYHNVETEMGKGRPWDNDRGKWTLVVGIVLGCYIYKTLLLLVI